MKSMKPLSKNFYERDPVQVAKDLLGKRVVRNINGKRMIGKIVETEAYYGKEDPASRASTTPKMAQPMWGNAGETFIYMVHNNWLFNVVTGKKGIPSAILVRAVEPLEGIELMKSHRNKEGFDISNGPGKLTNALQINKSHNGLKVYSEGDIKIIDSLDKNPLTLSASHRVGVKRDLEQPLRFYIQDNKWVSKGKVISEFSHLYK